MRYHVEQSHLAVDPLGYITRPTDRFDPVGRKIDTYRDARSRVVFTKPPARH